MAAEDVTMREDDATSTATDVTQAPAFSWADGIMDMVAKYDHNSDRQLFVYGISVSRCIQCRSRLKPNAKACSSCNEPTSSKTNACNRCSAANPCIWCYECDAYFCEPCHLKPHILALGDSAQPEHHCFPTDGAPGSLMHRGAWSDALFSATLTARREQMKQLKDSVAVKPNGSVGMQKEDAVKDVAKDQVLPTSDTPTAVESVPAQEVRQQAPSVPVQEARQQAPAQVVTQQTPSIRAHVVTQQTPSMPAQAVRQHMPLVPIQEAGQHAPSAPAHESRQQAPSVLPPVVPQPSIATPSEAEVVPPPSEPTQQSASSSESVVGRVERSRSPPPVPKVASSQAPPVSETPQHSLPHIKAEPVVAATSISGSRKRKAPTVDLTSSGDEATEAETSQAPAQPLLDGDGMALYARLRQMHSKTSRIQPEQPAPVTTAPRRPVSLMPPPTDQPTAMPTPSLVRSIPPQLPIPATQPQLNQIRGTPTATLTAPPPALHVDQISSLYATPIVPGTLPRPIEAPPPTPLFSITPATSQRLIHTQPSAQSVSSSSTIRSATTPVSSMPEDALAASVVEEYHKVNESIFMMEAQVAALRNYVQRAQVSNLNHAAQINQRINEYQRQILAADAQRYKALAKVVLFAPGIRNYARSLTHDRLFDNPDVIVANHKKCAELAKQIDDYQAQLKALQATIADAASSGDVNQLIQLNALSARTSQLKLDIEQMKKDRDGQFQIMVMFSLKLRETIHREMAEINQQQSAATRQ